MNDLDNLKQEIKENIDFAELFQDMVVHNKIHPKAITNPHLLDREGKVNIRISGSRSHDDYVSIPCLFHETHDDGAARLHLKDQYFKCFSSKCITGKGIGLFDLYPCLRFGIDPRKLRLDENKKYFYQGLKELAEFAGVPYTLEETEMSPERKKELKTIEIRTAAAELYHHAFYHHDNNEEAWNYLFETRGFEHGYIFFNDVVEKFKIGYAPPSFFVNKEGKQIPTQSTWLYDQLKKTYSDEELLEAGVVRIHQKKDGEGRPTGSKRIVDFIRHGIVIPYFSKGKINNLYCRSFTTSKDYRHLRLKTKVDIPVHFDEAKEHEWIIFTEGELSWLSLYALGYPSAVGNRGTKGLSDEHLELMVQERTVTGGKNCARVYFCFDSDGPGMEAIVKEGKRFMDAGFDVRIIRLPEGDPNDFLKKYGPQARDEFEKLRLAAISYDGFCLLYQLSKEKMETPTDKIGALKKVKGHLTQVDKLELLFLAEELSSVLQVDANLLRMLWIDL